MKKIMFILIQLLLWQAVLSQTISSRHGHRIPVSDTIRVFYVFAQLVNNPNANTT